MNSLMASVTCGMTCSVAPRYSPLPPDDRRIDPAGRHAVAAPRGNTGVALVMAEIEVGLGAVVGDVDLAMLIGRHGAGVDIEIGVELAQTDLEAARLQ